MTNFKHLTQIELSAYYNETLEKAERQKVKKHLLNCPDCRKRLPLPSVERFWTAIMTDSDTIEAPVKVKTEISQISIFARYLSFLKLQSGYLWNGALLVIIFSFSFLIWLSVANSNREVAGVINNEVTSAGQTFIPAPAPTLKVLTPSGSNRVVITPTSKQPKTDAPKQMPSRNNVVQKSERKALNKKDQISEIRGVSNICSEVKNVELEFSNNKENFVFKWKKVPNAVKYHLYISDDDEILIDEYETETETTFILKKSLDPLKSYKWKIIVTLENGKTIIGTSQKFTIKNFQNYQVKSEKQKNSDVRCQTNQ